MNAAIIEFNALADAVWSATQNDDFLPRGGAAFAYWGAETAFISGIHIGRLRCEFRRAGINTLIDRHHAKLGAECRHISFGAAGEHCQPLIGKAHGLDAAQRGGVSRQAIAADISLNAHKFFNFA